MFRFCHKKQRFLIGVFLAIEMLVASVTPVLAVHIPSPSEVAAELESRYHLNLGAIQNQGEFFNVADNKKQAPEVSLFFTPSDPKEGEKISVKAFPMYFTNPEEALYYTWYLKRADCDLDDSPGKDRREACDMDDNGRITVEDWKITAMRIIAQGGYDNTETSYTGSDDSDGYKSHTGGDNKDNTASHCYVHDNSSGINYETATINALSQICPVGMDLDCRVSQAINVTGAGSGLNNITEGTDCKSAGAPSCNFGRPVCSIGEPVCVDLSDPIACGTSVSGSNVLSCTGNALKITATPYCHRLLPLAHELSENGNFSIKGDNELVGDGSFGGDEERFWGTDPHDPSTANNGNKDEANVVGLGQTTFTWNYAARDKVGVAVEGTSIIPTKYQNSSSMVMWALPKNDCDVDSVAKKKGSFTQSIAGYDVSIPVADIDLNKCLERNLVDPTQGGQATNLDVSVSASPDNPINDETTDKSGDVVIAQASISNGESSLVNTEFSWKVEVSKNVQFSDKLDITKGLQDLGLIGRTRGNALDAVRVKLDIPASIGGDRLANYVVNGLSYMRFSVTASENASKGVSRKGRGDVIVKFVSTESKMTAYKVVADTSGSSVQVALPESADGVICNADALERNACSVVRESIIGLKIDKSDLSNFSWMINGSPLVCTARVSKNCENAVQGNINFFPVTGNVGDVYTVTATANDVKSGKSVTLTRTFHIVDPQVSIVSTDKTKVWPKFLGQYRDITGSTAANCQGGLCNDYSENIFQAFTGEVIGLQAAYLPSYLGTSPQTKHEWTVDGTTLVENSPNAIAFVASKPASGMYNVSVDAVMEPTVELRRALYDIWGISPLDSGEIRFGRTNQIELQDPDASALNTIGPKKYFAALVSYVPVSLLFTFRILLSAGLILFITGFLFALIPEDRRATIPGNTRNRA